MPTYIPLVNDGKLRALAVTSSARAPEPAGCHDRAGSGLSGLRGDRLVRDRRADRHAGRRIAKINAITNAWLKSPKGKAQLDMFAMQAAGGTPDDLKAYIKRTS